MITAHLLGMPNFNASHTPPGTVTAMTTTSICTDCDRPTYYDVDVWRCTECNGVVKTS